MPKITKPQNYSTLISDLHSIIEQGRKTAVSFVNTALVATYWLVGKRIVEDEQQGEKRAEYGESTLKNISKNLTSRFGKGFSVPQLKNIRQFYIIYSTKRYTLSSQFKIQKPSTSSKEKDNKKAQTVSGLFGSLSNQFSLSWSHYCLLMRLDDQSKREFYETECLKGNWSVRQLDRQIQSMLFERVALSKQKQSVISKAHQKPIILTPEDEIKDPYILEFLGLKDEYSESQLEEALIKHLEHFLLELGAGFTFVARQKRFTLAGDHYRIDLLLYHRILKCLVAIDLKIGKITPADAGQMNFYLNYLKDKEKFDGENDPVGIILCSDKKETVVKYATGGLSNKIFASQYQLQLPDPEVLKTEIEHEKQRLLEQKIIEEKEK